MTVPPASPGPRAHRDHAAALQPVPDGAAGPPGVPPEAAAGAPGNALPPTRGGIDDAGTWHRVHLASPFVRGWLAIVAVYVVFGRDWLQNAATSIVDPGSVDAALPGLPVWLVAVIAIVPFLIVVAAFVTSWWFTRYQVTADHVRVDSGVVVRQHRQARLDRVQAIDINQPLLARVLRLAELKFEVADAGASAMRLSFLRVDEAEQLRATILGRAAGLSGEADRPDTIAAAPERPVLTVPPQRVLGAAVASTLTVWLVVAAAVTALPAILSGEPVALAAVLPVLFGAVGAYWAFFSRSFNFRVAVSADGVRLHYGLLETHAQTVPPGRVQAVAVHSPLLWRLLGWHRVEMNVAGYGAQAREQGARTVLLPVGTLDDVMAVLALVLPDPGVLDPGAVFRAGLHGSGPDEGFTVSPPRARWLDPLAWRRDGFRLTDTGLLVRSGRLTHRLVVVPHERTQSIGMAQGPLQRRLGLAHVWLHSTPGPVRARVPHLATTTARQLFLDQAARSALARRAAPSDRWMIRRPVDDQPAEHLPVRDQPVEQQPARDQPVEHHQPARQQLAMPQPAERPGRGVDPGTGDSTAAPGPARPGEQA